MSGREGASCAHCGLPVSPPPSPSSPPSLADSPTGAGSGELFCCGGCQAAWQLLRSCDLSEFHRLRSGTGLPGAEIDATAFDSQGFAATHVRLRSDGLALVEWYVIGLHCPGCVWLLERLPRLDAGIRSGRVHFGLGRLTVVFDPALTSPGRQAALAARLGYRLKPWRDGRQAQAERRDMLLRFAVSAAAAIATMHLSLNLYAGELSRDLGATDTRLFGELALITASPAIAWGAAPFWRGAAASWRSRRLGMDATAALVIAVGTIASIANLWAGSRELYVDAVAMFIALLLLGRVAVLTARERVAAATAGLDHLLPTMARRQDGVDLPAEAVAPGELIVVRAGEVLPCDGTVAQAEAVIDQAVLTGESRPVTAAVGASAFAGTTCRSPLLTLRVTATGRATRLGAIIAGLGEGGRGAERSSRLPPLVDRLATWFTPLLAASAGAVWLGWWGAGQGGRGLDQAIALVLVSCPCALGLAVPLVQAVAISQAARRGLLIREPAVLETLGGHLKNVVFDKTGTLTEGRMGVLAWDWLVTADANLQAALRGSVAAAEDRSQHPLALAISAHLADVPRPALSSFRELAAQGVTASVDGHLLRVVSWPQDRHGQADAGPTPPLEEGRAVTRVLVEWDGAAVARISCADPLRRDLGAFLRLLERRGATLHLASGDDGAVARAVGAVLGFAPQRIHARQSPEDKAELVRRLAQNGPVAMVGDGLNDAAAMGQADVAVGLRGGLESALGSCQVFITRPQVEAALADLWSTARAARRRIRLILGVSLAYNLAGATLAAAGIWGPWLCGLAMPVASLTAVALAVTLPHSLSGPSPGSPLPRGRRR